MTFKKHQQGISLTEILIALAILAFGLVSLLKFQGSLWIYNDLAKQRIEAVIITQEKIEELRDYDAIATGSGTKAYQDIVSGTESITQGNTTYALSWTVTDNTSPAYKTLDVTTSWTGRKGTTHSVNLTSIISELDPIFSGTIVVNSASGI